MNQTAWIVIGGVAIIGLAIGLYVVSGQTPTDKYQIESKTLTLPPVTPEAKPNETPMTQTQTTPAPVGSMVTLKTNMGDITLKLHSADAPKTVENFVTLSRSGFYNGVKFHRVIKGFMIQGGDPLSKDDTQAARWGTGGPGYQFADEINPTSALYQKGYKRGVLAMANAGPNTNGSQFFIMHADYPLPPAYTIFGEVVSGIEVVDKIANSPTGAGDRPVTPMVINSVVVQ